MIATREEMKILEAAGFFSDEFRNTHLKLRQHYSLDQIIEMHDIMGRLAAAGVDLDTVLRACA